MGRRGRAKVQPMGAVRKSARLLMAAIVAAACACSHASAPDSDQVKVEVASVGIDGETGEHFVLLADHSGKRTLPIAIGDTEAQAILLELHGMKTDRPLTHDLLREMIERTGNHVDRVVIGDLRKETYYAVIYLDRGRYQVDSRPSDAIALALGINAPIFVATRLFESPPADALGPRTPELRRGLGLEVQELTPQLAGALGEQPHSGVLVSEVNAASAGVQRGDVITAVGGSPVRTLGDFAQAVASLKPGDSVGLTLKRDGAPQAATITVPPESGASR